MNLLAYVNNLAHYASECDLCTKRDLWKTKFLFEIPFAIAVDCMRILKVTRICGVIVALCLDPHVVLALHGRLRGGRSSSISSEYDRLDLKSSFSDVV